jgi:hypothetical protein
MIKILAIDDNPDNLTALRADDMATTNPAVILEQGGLARVRSL